MGGDMEEAVEQAVDSAVDVVAGRSGPSHLGRLAIVSAVALGTGAGVAWFVSKRYYKSKYESLAEQEIAEAKAFYAQLHKKDNFATPADAVETLGVDSEAVEAAVEVLEQYGSRNLNEVEVDVTETTEVEVRPVTSNVFEDRESDDVWDQDKEEAHRASIGEDEPYVISHMEFLENENDYVQQTLTYYAEDDVLVDEQEKPIELVDMVVGEDNLTRFGHGTMDNRIVFIRNDKLSLDFEVVKNDRSYSKEVLGFTHSDGPRIRKFRGGYE